MQKCCERRVNDWGGWGMGGVMGLGCGGGSTSGPSRWRISSISLSHYLSEVVDCCVKAEGIYQGREK